MDRNKQLIIIKSDLQMLTSANDEYLLKLLELSEAEIKREGITIGEDIESDMVIIHYAAYLFRKRAGADTSMPRYLRWELNNLLLSQKARLIQ